MYFDKGYRTERTDFSNPNQPAGPASVPPRNFNGGLPQNREQNK